MTRILTFLSSLFLALSLPAQGAGQPAAKVIQVKGVVQVDGKNLSAGTPLNPGQTITTGPDGSTLLALAAGQFLYVGRDSKAKITELKYGASGTDRSSVVTLESGYICSTLQPPVTGTTSHQVKTKLGTLSAHGTGWTTKSGDNVTVVPYSGTVIHNFPGIGDVALTPGMVATASTGPSGPTLRIVNILTGRVILYTPGQPPAELLADSKELAVAAKIFEDGVFAFAGTATEADLLALSKLIIEINALLARNQLVGIGNAMGDLWPKTLLKGITQLSGFASPETPNPNQ
jgi:hypothetical protein